VDGKWFSVECHFRIPPGDVVMDSGFVLQDRPSMYEQRVTVWQAASREEAALSAEAEADLYAEEAGYERLDYVVVYDLDVPPTTGAEVWSQVRHTALPPDEYLERYVTEGQPDGVATLHLPE
jgi:hypothetical protein